MGEEAAHGLRRRLWEWGAEGARGSKNKMHPAQNFAQGSAQGSAQVVLYEEGGSKRSRTAGGKRREEGGD